MMRILGVSPQTPNATKGPYSEVTALPMCFDILLLPTFPFSICLTFVCKTGATYQHLAEFALETPEAHLR